MHGAEHVIVNLYIIISYSHSAIVVLTSDSALVVRILELTLKDEGDVTTKVDGEIHYYIGVH